MRLPRHLADARGVTMVELLVCLLIMAILAAILLPPFLDQRAKGEDAEAKLTIRTAALALHAHYVSEHSFAATIAQLEEIEPSLDQARNLQVSGTADTFEIRERSASNTEFTMSRDPNGDVSRDCSRRGYGLCRDAANAHGDFW